MFQVDKIQTGLLGLVGINQPYDPAFAKLDAANQLSASGLFLDEVPNFKLQYFIETQDYKDISDSDLNDLLRTVQKSAISSVCQKIFGQYSYIDSNYVYTQASTRQTPETTMPNGFVGFRIVPSATKNVAFEITRTKLEFEGTGTVKIVLFNSNKNTPLYEQDVVITSNDQEVDLGWVLNSTQEDYKGEYFFGYVYDGTLVPYERDYEASFIENSISELYYERCYVTGGTDTTLFDLDDVKTLEENTGLNPFIFVHDDYTDLIIQNKRLFARAIQYQWAIQIMQEYASTVRSNYNERRAKELFMMITEQINGSVPMAPVKVTGLNTILATEIQMLRKTVEEIKNGYFGHGVQVQTLS